MRVEWHSLYRACQARPDLMRRFLKDLLTADRESRVYDLIRVGTAASLVVGLSLTVYTVYRGDPFDLTAFGTGIGLILAAGGGAMWARKDRETM